MFTYFYSIVSLIALTKGPHKAGLFSAALTGLVIDRSQTIQPTPTQQSAYFQKQSALLLNQISQQLSSLGATASISPDISLSDPTVNPSASDVRVNIFWFMSLVFSLSAALLATLVQRWAQDYMHMFELNSNPLNIARIRQYLRDGAERWGLPTTSEVVPGLIHFSLLLFFIGLADFLLHTYPIVGKFTLFPITFCVTLYIASTLIPIFDPQSPYRTSLSGLVWFFTPRLRSRRNDRFGKEPELLSSNMARAQMQLAMEKNDKREDRDKEAIGWLAKKLRDGEMESLTQGIPGSFTTGYGQKIWNRHRESLTSTPQPADETVPALPDAAATQNDDPNPVQLDQERAVPWVTGALRVLRRPPVRTRLDPGNMSSELTADMAEQRRPQTVFCLPRLPFATSSRIPPQQLIKAPSIPPERVVSELCERIRHLFETYDHRDRISEMEEWRKRSRACVETAASFVFCMGVDLGKFGDIGKLLSDLGKAEKTSEWSETSLNRSFMTRWTCLSLVATRRMLKTSSKGRLQQCARVNIGLFVLYKVAEDDSSDTDNLAFHNAKTIDTQLETAWDCVDKLYSGLMRFRGHQPKEAGEAALEVGKTLLPKLKDIEANANGMGLIDMGILTLQSEIDNVSHRLTRQLPGVTLDTPKPTTLAEIVDFISDPIGPQLLYLQQRFHRLRSFHEGHIQEVVSKILEKISSSPRVAVHQQRLMVRQLWRLQDLSVGGAFGFTLELYFLVLRKLLPSSASSGRDSGEFATFYMGAFKAITDDWEDYVRSPGTIQIILNLVCDICVPDRGIFSNFRYPDIIMMELVATLRKMISGRPSPYIEAAKNELRDVVSTLDDKDFRWAAYKATLDSLSVR